MDRPLASRRGGVVPPALQGYGDPLMDHVFAKHGAAFCSPWARDAQDLAAGGDPVG